MRVLGIDCGTEYTGYGVVDLLPDDRLVCIICGAIKVSPRDPMPARLSRISISLRELISQHRPDRVAIELNREIVSRDRWPQTLLHDGDRLEIVHFVGGGSSPTVCLATRFATC